MLSVEIRVNGTIITAVTAVNRGLTAQEKTSYEVQGVRFPANCSGPPKAFHAFVKHKRSDGAESLVKKLLVAAAKGGK